MLYEVITRQLEQTRYEYQLKPERGLFVNIDGFHMGIGGDDSWSPSVHADDLLLPGEYQYHFTLKYHGQ